MFLFCLSYGGGDASSWFWGLLFLSWLFLLGLFWQQAKELFDLVLFLMKERFCYVG